MFIIYKILFEDGEFYIGHTNNLNNRIRQHRHSAKTQRCFDYPLYKKLREEQHEYIIVESKECDKQEITLLENKYILELEPPLNQRNIYDFCIKESLFPLKQRTLPYFQSLLKILLRILSYVVCLFFQYNLKS